MRTRRGFTLVELLIVLALVVTLTTLVVAVAPRFGERQRASRGAGMLQSWLNLAKQRALRDGRPVGIRLPTQQAPQNPTPSYIREVLYVEVPDETIGGTVMVPFDYYNPFNPEPNVSPPQTLYPSAATEYSFIRLKTTVQLDPASPLLQPGDVITFPDRQTANYNPRRIISVQVPPGGSPIPVSQPGPNGSTYYNYMIQLDQPLPQSKFTTQTHQFSRKARPVAGESVLQLPQDIAIDITQDQTNSPPTYHRFYPPLNTGGSNPLDILFAPSGQVVGFGSFYPRICLWVRDVSLGDPGPDQLPPGENTLITIYTKTGQIAAHPIDPSGLVPNTSQNRTLWNPFRFTQDGLPSGQ